MRKRQILAHGKLIVVALLSAVTLLAAQVGMGASPPVSARSATPAVVFGPPAIVGKVTLADTSIDGPSLWTNASGDVRAVLGWAGTDTAHRLNVMTSADGMSYGNKVTLNETSDYRPAVVSWGGDTDARIDIAWTGTDQNHSLNIRLGVYGQGYNKLTLKDNSFTAPALTIFNGDLFLAWAGTDSNHSLNVLQIIPRGGILTQNKVILRQYSSISRPSLSTDPNGNHLILSWTSPDGRIHFVTSSNGQTWGAATTIYEASDVGPSMLGIPMNNMPRHWLAWRGTDAAHSLNVQYTESYPSWPSAGAKSVLSEMAFGGPSLGFVGVYRQVIIGWTGTDTAHHLNVARIGV